MTNAIGTDPKMIKTSSQEGCSDAFQYPAEYDEESDSRLLNPRAAPLKGDELLFAILSRRLPTGTARQVAAAILKRYGSFAQAVFAYTGEISTISGLPRSAIADLALVRHAALELLRFEGLQGPILSNWDRLIEYVSASCGHLRTEQLRVIYLDSSNRVIENEIFAEGAVGGIKFSLQQLVRRSIDLYARSIVLIHNHPSGDPTPSKQDIEFTGTLRTVLEHVSIRLSDHIIVGRGKYVSFRQDGLLG